MIIEHFPSLRATPPQSVVVLPPKNNNGFTNNQVRPDFRDRARATLLNISLEEFLRRDQRVRQLFLDCPFHANEDVRPRNADEFNKYGMLKIQGVLKTYHDFNANEKWPEDDEPFIVTTWSEKVKSVIFCTSGYLMKANNGGTC